MTPEEEVQRGRLAEQVLDNPIYREAVMAAKADLFDQWASAKWFQARKMKELWRMYRAVEAIESKIEKVMKTGKMGKQTIDHRNKLKKVS